MDFDATWEKRRSVIERWCRNLAIRYQLDWGDIYSAAYLKAKQSHRGDGSFTNFVSQACVWAAIDMARRRQGLGRSTKYKVFSLSDVSDEISPVECEDKLIASASVDMALKNAPKWFQDMATAIMNGEPIKEIARNTGCHNWSLTKRFRHAARGLGL